MATASEVIDRLEVLWRKLEDDGWYVSANTVSLAIDEIKRLREFKAAAKDWQEIAERNCRLLEECQLEKRRRA